ncbi:MAG TPA: nuclear transport factor 2 family protein [Burkholderiales bacterium]|nr:nuclear transport factor 2 family protein [Burkholderiales bacterium]
MLRTLIRALRGDTANYMVPAGAAGPQDCSGTITVEEALKAEDARFAAQMAGDAGAMQRLFGDDLVYIHSSTLEDTKASFIESIRSGNVKYRSMKRGDVKVRTYGCIAIVTGSANFEVTARGQELSLHLLYHAVWAKRPAGVQFVSWQATRVMPK